MTLIYQNRNIKRRREIPLQLHMARAFQNLHQVSKTLNRQTFRDWVILKRPLHATSKTKLYKTESLKREPTTVYQEALIIIHLIKQ